MASLQDAFDEFVAWCGRDTDCALQGRDVRVYWNGLLDRAARGELHSPEDPTYVLRPSDIVNFAKNVLQGPDWAFLADNLLAVGDGTNAREVAALREPPDLATDRAGLFCNDFSLPVRDYREYDAHLRRSARIAPGRPPARPGRRATDVRRMGPWCVPRPKPVRGRHRAPVSHRPRTTAARHPLPGGRNPSPSPHDGDLVTHPSWPPWAIPVGPAGLQGRPRWVYLARTGWRVLAGAHDGEVAPPPLAALRIGLPAGPWSDRLDGAVRERFDRFVDGLARQGARFTPVPVPDAEELHQVYVLVQSAEVAAIHQERLAERPELFGEEILQRLRTAASVPGYGYARALRRLTAERESAARRLAGLDLLLLPTTPVLAPPIGARDTEIGGGWTSPRDALLAHNALWGVLGLPALSMPIPAPSGTLPVGAQLAPGADEELLAAATTLERAARA